VYSKTVSSTLTLERETLHISDDTGRIALIDTRTTGSGTEPAQLLRYQYSNHLSTATLELDDAAAIISYEEYYPYGSTSFQSGRSGAEVSLKRYRYTGKERDEETGLYYHGARYYVPWLARWSASDPLESKYAGRTPYCYGADNPVSYNDPNGMQEEDEVSVVKNAKGEIEYHATLPEIVVTAQARKTEEGSAPVDLPSFAFSSAMMDTRDGPLQFYGTPVDNLAIIERTAELKKQEMQERVFSGIHWDSRYIGEDKSGNSYNTSRREIAMAQYQRQQMVGEAIRTGFFASVGYLANGEQGAMAFSVIDGVSMSFAGVGTPYGKVEPVKLTEQKNIPYMEMPLFSILKSSEATPATPSADAAKTGMYIPKTPLAQQKVAGWDIPLPDPLAGKFPHTTLGGKIGSDGILYRQSATFTGGSWPLANGKIVPWSRVDWTTHGRPLVHPNPHQHIFNFNNGKNWQYGKAVSFP